jgi:hypothetical protein
MNQRFHGISHTGDVWMPEEHLQECRPLGDARQLRMPAIVPVRLLHNKAAVRMGARTGAKGYATRFDACAKALGFADARPGCNGWPGLAAQAPVKRAGHPSCRL